MNKSKSDYEIVPTTLTKNLRKFIDNAYLHFSEQQISYSHK